MQSCIELLLHKRFAKHGAAGLFNKRAEAAGSTAEHWQAGGHGLKQHRACPLSARRMQHQIGGKQKLGHIIARAKKV